MGNTIGGQAGTVISGLGTTAAGVTQQATNGNALGAID
jgi:hypothetical protein